MTDAQLSKAPQATMKTARIEHFDCPACGAATPHCFYCVKDGWDIHRCTVCGIGRIDPKDFRPSEAYDEAYFSGGHGDGYRNYKGSEPILAREFADTVAHLRRFATSGRLLEIGCAYGFFLDQARRHFDVVGVEISDAAAQACIARGLNVHPGELTPELADRTQPLDALVMLDVIEHIGPAFETLALATGRMRPGAFGLITTGDFSSLGARLLGRRWRLLTPPLHMWFFTQESIVRMLARLNCRVVALDYPWKWVPLDLVLQQVVAMVGLRSPRLPAFLGRLAIPANSFDAMRIVFRRDS